jgi:alpha-galactosidase
VRDRCLKDGLHHPAGHHAEAMESERIACTTCISIRGASNHLRIMTVCCTIEHVAKVSMKRKIGMYCTACPVQAFGARITTKPMQVDTNKQHIKSAELTKTNNTNLSGSGIRCPDNHKANASRRE